MGVEDERRARGQIAQVRLQRRRVHRHQHVRTVARRQNVVVGEMHLERRHPRQRPLRRADLGREVRQRRQIITENRRLCGESVTRQLHTVSGVPGNPDHDPVELLNSLGHAGGGLPASVGVAFHTARCVLRNPLILRSCVLSARVGWLTY